MVKHSGSDDRPDFARYMTEADQERRRSKSRSVDRLVEWARYLPPEEQAVVHWVYREGRSVAALARERGVPAGQLQRQLRRVLKRMKHPRYRYTARSLEMFPRHLQVTAKQRFLWGYSLRQMEACRRLSLHKLRVQVTTLETLIDAGLAHLVQH
ncbi:MAG: hypothetical protein AAGI68_06155 [Planctomycetota bacterium]